MRKRLALIVSILTTLAVVTGSLSQAAAASTAGAVHAQTPASSTRPGAAAAIHLTAARRTMADRQRRRTHGGQRSPSGRLILDAPPGTARPAGPVLVRHTPAALAEPAHASPAHHNAGHTFTLNNRKRPSAGLTSAATGYVTNLGSGTVTPITTATGTAGTPIPVGTNPVAIAITGGQACQITSASTSTFTAGQAGTFAVQSTGRPQCALSETGPLPPGVTFHDNRHGTATLAGTPAAGSGGTYKFTITAANGTTDATQSFTLTINQAPTVIYSGTIRLTQMGLYLDDRNNSSSNGAVVQVWQHTGGLNQVWKVMSDGTIRHNGLCLDAAGGGTANGTKVQLWACTGQPSQQWNTKNFRVNYMNPAAIGKVLDDTGYGGNGTQQEIWANNGTRNQIWATS